MDGKARRSLQPGGWRPGERPTPVKAASGAPPGIATNSRLSRFRSERQLTSATLWNWRIPVTARAHCWPGLSTSSLLAAAA
ncbi:hypothetical protein DAI22_11g120000 [Oryza sativa Japonica Group]|nr:hypothetical protein DAI22_11g120000 [Oryza sativa Japonica Group]